MEFVPAKTIITRTKSGEWFGSDYTMNIYRGCCHGCIYCDSRSSCYRISDFARVRAKENALVIIRDELRRKVRTGVVATGSMSDPYNPFEREFSLTRHALELLSAYSFGVAIATKSDLITRDIDVLQEIRAHSPVICKLTITTADDTMSAKLEPHAPSSSQRFAAIKALSEAGIFSGILLMPVLPYIEDNEENILKIIRLGVENGAKFIYPAFGVTMREGQREWLLEQLDKQFPGEQMRGKYEKQYGDRYRCTSPHAKRLWHVFSTACDQFGIYYRMADIIRAYKMGYGDQQLAFI